jgi:hypothetical protein
MQLSMKQYEARHLRDCLLAQAALCERMAATSWSESSARRLHQMAKECRDAAASSLEPAKQDAHVS